MKQYRGVRTSTEVVVVVIEDGVERPLDIRHDLRRHSESYQWSYSGSGPAQLSLALCADALGDDEDALNCYQRWKNRVLSGLEADEWEFDAAFVCRVAADILAERHREVGGEG